jgi:hypothetical protein
MNNPTPRCNTLLRRDMMCLWNLIYVIIVVLSFLIPDPTDSNNDPITAIEICPFAIGEIRIIFPY